MVQETAIADLKKNGLTLISIAEPDLMATDPTRVLMRQLMGAVAQYEKSQIVAKLRGARMRVQEDSYCQRFEMKEGGMWQSLRAIIARAFRVGKQPIANVESSPKIAAKILSFAMPANMTLPLPLSSSMSVD